MHRDTGAGGARRIGHQLRYRDARRGPAMLYHGREADARRLDIRLTASSAQDRRPYAVRTAVSRREHEIEIDTAGS